MREFSPVEMCSGEVKGGRWTCVGMALSAFAMLTVVAIIAA